MRVFVTVSNHTSQLPFAFLHSRHLRRLPTALHQGVRAPAGKFLQFARAFPQRSPQTDGSQSATHHRTRPVPVVGIDDPRLGNSLALTTTHHLRHPPRYTFLFSLSGGICYVGAREFKANMPHLPDYDPTQHRKIGWYVDANNL